MGANSRCFTPKRVNSICRAWNWFKAFWWGKKRGGGGKKHLGKRKSTLSSFQSNWIENGKDIEDTYAFIYMRKDFPRWRFSSLRMASAVTWGDPSRHLTSQSKDPKQAVWHTYCAISHITPLVWGEVTSSRSTVSCLAWGCERVSATSVSVGFFPPSQNPLMGLKYRMVNIAFFLQLYYKFIKDLKSMI